MLRYAATFQVYYSELVETFTGNAHKQNIDDIIISTYIYEGNEATEKHHEMYW